MSCSQAKAKTIIVGLVLRNHYSFFQYTTISDMTLHYNVYCRLLNVIFGGLHLLGSPTSIPSEIHFELSYTLIP